VIAAAVVLPPGTCLDGVADSKVLQAPVRERLATEIRRRALAVGLGIVEPEEIDRLNIYRAGLTACRRALDALRPLVPGYVLVDGREIPDLPMPQSAYPKGARSLAWSAAASSVPRVGGAASMSGLAARYPVSGFPPPL